MIKPIFYLILIILFQYLSTNVAYCKEGFLIVFKLNKHILLFHDNFNYKNIIIKYMWLL